MARSTDQEVAAIESRLVPFDEVRRTARWDEWRGLATAVPPHLSPEFFQLNRPLVEDGEHLVVQAVAGGKLVGVLPIMRQGRVLTSLRSQHMPAFDYCGSEAALSAVARTLLSAPAWDVLVLKNVPKQSMLATALPRLLVREGCQVVTRPGAKLPYFELPGFEEQLSAKFRANLRRCDKKLGSPTLERTTAFSQEAIESAMRIEATPWKIANKTNIAADGKLRRLYEGLARLYSSRGQFAASFLVSGGKRVAVLLSLEDGHGIYALKIGYDTAYSSVSPGHVLVWKVAKEAEARGLRELDFMGNADAWKLKWTDRAREQIAMVIYRPTVRGQATYVLRELVKPRLPEPLREPRFALRWGCQQQNLVGDHTLTELVRGRVRMGLGIKRRIRNVVSPDPTPKEPLGRPSSFKPGDWVRVVPKEKMLEVLDERSKTRGLEFVPQQWDTCDQRYRVQSVVRRIRDDGGRLRSVGRTVLLEGVECTGDHEPKGCGRHCPLMYRDEWLERADAPSRGPTEARPGLYARVRALDEIHASLDIRGTRDGLMFMAEMGKYVGKRSRVAHVVERVFELDRWVPARSPLYVLESLHCTGAALGGSGPCHRACALLWHPDWLILERVESAAAAE
ncbi:MAG: GNAT family N-acetyltransferase [Polyangiaceae bacterium]|nr:GNAT family N-acetyltransferase [Polyangiaceae bacterium]